MKGTLGLIRPRSIGNTGMARQTLGLLMRLDYFYFQYETVLLYNEAALVVK